MKGRMLGLWMVGAVLISASAVQAQFVVQNSAPAAQQASGAAPAASIDRPTQEQLARLFEVMRIRKQMENMRRTLPLLMRQQMQAQMAQATAQTPGVSSLSPERKQELTRKSSELILQYMDKVLDLYPVEEMLVDLGALYQRHLSAADIEAYIAFYSSEPGQHLLDVQPLIMQEYMPLLLQRQGERGKGIQAELAAAFQKLAKEEIASQKSSAASGAEQKPR